MRCASKKRDLTLLLLNSSGKLVFLDHKFWRPAVEVGHLCVLLTCCALMYSYKTFITKFIPELRCAGEKHICSAVHKHALHPP
jgi:hypothetical protein